MLYLQDRLNQKKMKEVKIDSYEYLKNKIQTISNAVEQENKKEIENGYFISGRMIKPERLTENVKTRDLLVIDYDNLQDTTYNGEQVTHAIFKKRINEILSNYNYLLYPTYSASTEKVNYRLVVKLAREVRQEEYYTVGWILIDQIGLKVDASTLEWGRIQGTPVKSPTNKNIKPIVNAVNNNYPVAELELLRERGATDRAKQIERAYKHRTSPKIDDTERFTEKEYNNTLNNQNALEGQKIAFYDAIAIMKDYQNHEQANLQDYNNYISCQSTLIAEYQKGNIDGETLQECVNILADGNEEWKTNNLEKLKENINTDIRNKNKYDFLGKFLLSLKNQQLNQKYSYLLKQKTEHGKTVQAEQEERKILREIEQANLRAYTLATIPKEWLGYLTKQQMQIILNGDNALTGLEEFKKAVEESEKQELIKTGFENLDKLLSGGLRSGLYFNGAISSLGKTTLLMQIADNIARQRKPVIIFSLEMDKKELIGKSLSRITYELSVEDCKVKEPKMKYGDKERYNALTYYQIQDKKNHKYFTDYQKNLYTRAFQKYSEYAKNIMIYESLGQLTATEISQIVKTVANATKTKPVVFIDYLQILAPTNPRATDKQNTDTNVLELKQLSRDLSIPVIAISSLNRQSYNAEMNMTAFKESGAIEYSSDVLLGMQLSAIRDSKDVDIEEEKRKEPRKVDVKLLKQRNGIPSGIVAFDFIARFNYFQELEEVKPRKTKEETEKELSKYKTTNKQDAVMVNPVEDLQKQIQETQQPQQEKTLQLNIAEMFKL